MAQPVRPRLWGLGVETGHLDPDPQQALCSEAHLVDALHPAFLQVHLGAQEVGMLAVVAGHLEVHVNAVGGTGGRHYREEVEKT